MWMTRTRPDRTNRSMPCSMEGEILGTPTTRGEIARPCQQSCQCESVQMSAERGFVCNRGVAIVLGPGKACI